MGNITIFIHINTQGLNNSGDEPSIYSGPGFYFSEDDTGVSIYETLRGHCIYKVECSHYVGEVLPAMKEDGNKPTQCNSGDRWMHRRTYAMLYITNEITVSSF